MTNNPVRLVSHGSDTVKLLDYRYRLTRDLGEYLELIQELLGTVSEVKSTKQRALLTELVQRLVDNYKELASDVDEVVGTGSTNA